MKSRIFVFFLTLACLALILQECSAKGGGHGGSHGGHSSHGGGSHGYHSGGSHSHHSGGSSGSSWGRSGGSGSHTYPSSSSGLSGSSSRGSHSYPPSSGLSGSGSSRNTYYGHGSYGSHYNAPTYYTAPQHVYITEYRSSDSRYSDVLHGLTLYNLGRSHSHYNNHYYYDDYYRTRYNGQSSSYNSDSSSLEAATCKLIMKGEGKKEELKIPCEIVSTFTEGSKNQTVSTETKNETVCVTTTTTYNQSQPGDTTFDTNAKMVNTTTCKTVSNVTDPLIVKGPKVDASNMECSVEIKTKSTFLVNKVSCKTLMEYSKLKEPPKNEGSMPSREKLKSWLANPPWWMSVLIAV